jgi:hypothetical protein
MEKIADSNINPSFSSYTFYFAQTNPHPTGTSVGGKRNWIS